MPFGSQSLSSQAATHAQDKYELLAHAIKNHNSDLMQRAISQAIDPTQLHYTLDDNQVKFSALHLAAYYNYAPGMASLLLQVKNPEQYEDLFGECVLLAAVRNYHHIVALFVKYELNSNIASLDADFKGFNAMHFAILHENKQMEFNLTILGFQTPSSQEKLRIAQLRMNTQTQKLRNACVLS